MKYLANILTFCRIVLVWPFCVLLLDEHYTYALILFIAASLTDLIDGMLARRYGCTRLGSILDPAADKILVVSAYSCLGYMGILPVWLLGVVVGRDLMLIFGTFLYHCRVRPFEFAATNLSKLNTCFQLALLTIVILTRFVTIEQAAAIINWISLVVATTTIGSGIQYIILAIKLKSAAD